MSKTSSRLKEVDAVAEEKARPLRDAADVVKEVERMAALGYTDANSPDVRQLKARFLELLEEARQALVPSGGTKK
jgi:hypothetical protein